MQKITIVLLLALFVFAGIIAADSSPRKIKICALRVEFIEDQNPLTTGNGRFMIDTVTTDPYAIDPAPHNRQYFADQITAVNNYFDNVSGGMLRIQGDVFPTAENEAYRLPNQMGYYNPNTTDEEINLGLSRLLVDAIKAADADGDIVFSDYDLVVVFHAGVGRDIALDFDSTPQDISSLFITENFLKNTLGSNFSGISVDDGAKVFSEGMILPETENQDGRFVAMTGIFAANIGSYLKLYDLFDPETGRPGVGSFDLMDNGLINVNGLMPSPPGAFSRMILGWDEPLTIDAPQNSIEIARLGSDNPAGKPTLIKIPINDDEYYLLEYRGDPISIKLDSLYLELSNERLNQGEEAPTYLEILETEFPEKIEKGESGVLISVENYDWGLPGYGILIWHIDEKVIREKGPENRINDDREYRAVDIEEADGAQDIGRTYSFLEAGYGTELGWAGDFWFSNRPDNWGAFDTLYQNEFSDRTAPGTRANLNRAVTNITLKNFSANTGETMTFDFLRGVQEDYYPLSFEGTKNAALVAGAVQDRGGEFLFYCSSAGKIYAAGNGNKGLYFEDKSIIANTAKSNETVSLALADNDGDGAYDQLFAAGETRLYGYDLLNARNDSTAAALFPAIKLPDRRISPLVTGGGKVFVSCANDTVYQYGSDGNLMQSQMIAAGRDIVLDRNNQLSFYLGGFDYTSIVPLGESGTGSLLAYSGNDQKLYFIDPALSESTGDVVYLSEHPGFKTEMVGQFIVTDLDGNGTYDLVYNGATTIEARNVNGTPLTNFPMIPKLNENDRFVGTPLIFDADDDGDLDIIAALRSGTILAYDVNGNATPGFPLATGGAISHSPLLMQLDADEEMELIAVSDSGSVYAWQMAVTNNNVDILWQQANLNATNNVLITEALLYQPVGSALMPEQRAYNYPNPNTANTTRIRYYLNEQAEVKIRIFDTAGTLIDSFDGPGMTGTDNEVTWNVADIASGVYLCQIEAKSTSKTERILIKIMVVH